MLPFLSCLLAQGKHESLSEILDPKYQPWANAAPRKAYYEGY